MTARRQQVEQLRHMMSINTTALEIVTQKMARYDGLAVALLDYAQQVALDNPLHDVLDAARSLAVTLAYEMSAQKSHLELERKSMQYAMEQMESPILVPGLGRM